MTLLMRIWFIQIFSKLKKCRSQEPGVWRYEQTIELQPRPAECTKEWWQCLTFSKLRCIFSLKVLNWKKMLLKPKTEIVPDSCKLRLLGNWNLFFSLKYVSVLKMSNFAGLIWVSIIKWTLLQKGFQSIVYDVYHVLSSYIYIYKRKPCLRCWKNYLETRLWGFVNKPNKTKA